MVNTISVIFLVWFLSALVAFVPFMAIRDINNKEVNIRICISQAIFWPVFAIRGLIRGFIDGWRE